MDMLSIQILTYAKFVQLLAAPTAVPSQNVFNAISLKTTSWSQIRVNYARQGPLQTVPVIHAIAVVCPIAICASRWRVVRHVIQETLTMWIVPDRAVIATQQQTNLSTGHWAAKLAPLLIVSLALHWQSVQHVTPPHSTMWISQTINATLARSLAAFPVTLCTIAVYVMPQLGILSTLLQGCARFVLWLDARTVLIPWHALSVTQQQIMPFYQMTPASSAIFLPITSLMWTTRLVNFALWTNAQFARP